MWAISNTPSPEQQEEPGQESQHAGQLEPEHHLAIQTDLREHLKEFPYLRFDAVKATGRIKTAVKDELLNVAVAACKHMCDARSGQDQEFQAAISTATHLPIKPEAEGGMIDEVRYILAGLCRAPDAVPDASPMGWCEVHTLRRGKVYVDLLMVWCGSTTLQDLVSNLDFRPTPTFSPAVAVHSGFFALFNTWRDVVGDRLEKATEHQNLKNIVFSGHSQAGALAELFHLQLTQASEFSERVRSHWPLSDRVWARCAKRISFSIAFAAPPSFYVKPNLVEDNDRLLLKEVQARSINLVMQHDVVPKITQEAALDALASVGLAHADSHGPVARWLTAKFSEFVQQRAVESLPWTTLQRCQHLSQVLEWRVDMEKMRSKWEAYSTPEEQSDWMSRPWEFKGLATTICETDHHVLPGQVVPDWRQNHCAVVCDECATAHENALFDCPQCRQSFCQACNDRKHDGDLSDHLEHVEGPRTIKICKAVTLRTLRFQRNVEERARQYELEVKARWCNGALVLPSLGFSAMVFVSHEGDISCFEKFAHFLRHVDFMPADAVAAVVSGAIHTCYLFYRRWSRRDLDASEFWCALLEHQFGTLGACGAAMLVHSFVAPLGVCLAMPFAVAASFVAGLGIRALIRWIRRDFSGSEKLTFAMVGQAMDRLGLLEDITEDVSKKLEEMTTRDVANQYKKMALKSHPDKVLHDCRECNLSEMETKRRVSEATVKFQGLQHDKELLDSLIEARSERDDLDRMGKFIKAMRDNCIKARHDRDKAIRRANSNYEAERNVVTAMLANS